jgi:hypothetical protein
MIVASSNLNELIRLLAASVLLHELLNISNRGMDYVSRCVAPVFGLKLNRLVHSVIHILLMIVTAWLCLHPDARLLPPMLLLLSAVIASYSIRLSNHLVVSWFFFLTLTTDFLRHGTITTTSVMAIRALVILTYAFAAFHKLNHDYVSPQSSCGIRLLHFYFQGRLANIWTNRLIVVGGIWAPVIVEGAIPVLLLFNQTRVVGVFVAVCLQSLFGLARNAHFSVVMYAGLVVFLPPTTLSPQTLLIVCAVGGWVGFRYSMWKAYPIRRLALILHLVFGVIAVYMVVQVIITAGNSVDDISQEGVDWLVISVLLLFALNAASPFYSSKTEFSLAMFSNVRPDRWAHIVVKQPHRQLRNNEYVEILRMQGMPELSSCSRASLAYKLVRAFKPYEGRKYLKYYLVESITNLQDQLASDFFVELTDSKQHFRFSSLTDLSRLKHRKVCLMPAVIASDPHSPYCN